MFDLSIGVNEFWGMGLAIICGAVIGLERELHGKSAGLRTNILICLGASVFVIVARVAGDGDTELVSRVAAGVVTGIGFLGAGTIIQDRMSVRGLTTAAGIWLVAAVGMACGAGLFGVAIIVTAAAVVVLLVFSPFDRLLHRIFGDRVGRDDKLGGEP
jgi:putative Mg2+ transporter-C (MgtC) family protein